MKKLITIALLFAALGITAQPLPPATTVYTRQLLKSADSNAAMVVLGLVSNGVTVVTNWITIPANASVTVPKLAQAVSNAWMLDITNRIAVATNTVVTNTLAIANTTSNALYTNLIAQIGVAGSVSNIYMTNTAIVVGTNSIGGDYDVIIGNSASAGNYSVAIGYGALSSDVGTDFVGGIAIGVQSDARLEGVAIGRSANAVSGGVAIGSGTGGMFATNYGVAIGSGANGRDYGVGIGFQAEGTVDGVAIGQSSDADTNGVAIGLTAKGRVGGISIGQTSIGDSNGVAIGSFAVGWNTGNVAIGKSAVISNGWQNTVQLGTGTATSEGGLHFKDFLLVNANGAFVLTNAVLLQAYETTQTVANTNWAYLSGFGNTDVDGAYFWTNTLYKGSNLNYSFYFDGAYWNVTNGAGDIQYLTPNAYITTWADLGGTDTNGVGAWATNEQAVSSFQVSSSTAPALFPKGLTSAGAGGSMNFGRDTVLRRGLDPENGQNHDDLPSIIHASNISADSGFLDTILSSSTCTNHGDGVAIIASGNVSAWADNNNLAILGSEFCVVSNDHGVAFVAASGNLTNLGRASVSVVGVTGGHIDEACTFFSVPYGYSLWATNTQYSFVGGNSVTSSVADRVFVLGNRLGVQTSSNTFVFGSGLNMVGKTNHMELGMTNGTVHIEGTLSGDGSGLTGIPSSALTGDIPAGWATEGEATNAINNLNGVGTNLVIWTAGYQTNAITMVVSNGAFAFYDTNGYKYFAGTNGQLYMSVSNVVNTDPAVLLAANTNNFNEVVIPQGYAYTRSLLASNIEVTGSIVVPSAIPDLSYLRNNSGTLEGTTDGSLWTNLPASVLTGTVPDARLSTNVVVGVTNTGAGVSLISSSNGPVPVLKSLTNGANITLTDNGTNISIASTASGGGGTNSGPIVLTFSDTNVAVVASTPVGCVTNAPLYYRLTMTTNALIGNPTGMLDGQRIVIEFIQDATGSRIAYFDTDFAFGTDITGCTLTTTASKRDFATFVYSNSKWYCVGFTRGY